MKLEYFDLLSPTPIHIGNIGHIKSPTLKEISQIGYQQYNGYLSILLLTPENYFKSMDKDKFEQYQALDDETKMKISMFEIMLSNKDLLFAYLDAFNFFFVEYLAFDPNKKVFCIYSSQKDIENKIKPLGIINSNIFGDVCDIMLQLNNIFRDYANEDYKKVKNNRALEILKKLKKGQAEQNKKNKFDKRVELSNVISALSAYHNNLNMVNIWDLTVFQLYDQFKRLQSNSIFNMNSMSVSVWGDKDNKFDATRWYQLMDD